MSSERYLERRRDRNGAPEFIYIYKLLDATYQQWLAGRVALAGWLAGWLDGLLAGQVAGSPVKWMAGWRAGWLAGRLVG